MKPSDLYLQSTIKVSLRVNGMSESDLQVIFEHMLLYRSQLKAVANFVDDRNTWGTRATKGSM